jgi:Ni/Co efflux regulator RcnB
MRNLIVPAALAMCLGSTAAFAQADTEKSTTTVTTPSGTTQTTTQSSQSNDGYAQYRRTVTSTKHYNAGAFVAPSGYSYTRYSLGQRVPGALLSSDTLNNYSAFALESPPAGLTWVRVGDDALLVDQNTGEVVQADYDLFKI